MTKQRVTAAAARPISRTQPATGVRIRQLYLTAVIVVLAFWMALPFLTPIAWAAVFAMAEWPLFKRVERYVTGRPFLLALGFTIATALLVVLPLSVAAVSLAQESQAALNWVQHVQHDGLATPGWIAGLPLVGGRAAAWWQQNLANPAGANALLGTVSAGSALGWTRSVAGEVAKESALFLITLVILTALLARGRSIAEQFDLLAGRMFGAFGRDFTERLTGAVRSTVVGTLLVSFIEGALIGVAYAVAGVPQALLFATFTILLALVPFGAWAAFGLASLILIGSGSVLAGVLLFGFGVAVMTIGDNVVQPAVVGSAVELPFLLALIGAFGGLSALGLVGLFIGPVIMAALLLIGQEWMIEPDAPSAA